MGARVRKDAPSIAASVGVHADVEIKLVMQPDDAEGAEIHFGNEGPELILDFADVDSLNRLAIAAAEGAEQLRTRLAELYPNRAAMVGEAAAPPAMAAAADPAVRSGRAMTGADQAGTTDSLAEPPASGVAAESVDAEAGYVSALTTGADLGSPRMRADHRADDRAAELVDQ